MQTKTTWTYTLTVVADEPQREVAEHEFVGAVQEAVAASVVKLVRPGHLEVSAEQQDVRVDSRA